MKYEVQISETGDVLADNITLEEATQYISELEADDEREGVSMEYDLMCDGELLDRL